MNTGMRKITLGAVAAALAALSLPAGTAVAAGDTTVATPEATVTLSVGDVAFDGPDCVKTPVTISYTKTGPSAQQTTMRLALNANQAGADNRIGLAWTSYYWDPPTGAGQVNWMQVCPRQIDNTRGPLTISGTLETSTLSGTKAWSPVPTSPVILTYNPTHLTKPRSRARKGFPAYYEISGAATALTTTKGTVPAGGTLTLQLRKPGRTAWVSGLTTTVDSYGEYTFRLMYPEKYPKGTRFRVALTGCGWCTNAMANGRL